MQVSSEIESRVVIASRPRTLVLVISPDAIDGAMHGPTGVQLGSSRRLARDADARTAFAAMWPELEALGEFDRVAVTTKPGLGDGWELDAITRELELQCGRRVRASASELRWRSSIRRTGVELVLAVGDELESALFFDGVHVPGLALGRHRFRKGRTYAKYVAPRVRERKGVVAWNRRLQRVVDEVLAVWNPTLLYIAIPPGVAVALERHANVLVVPMTSDVEAALALWKPR